MNTMSFINSDLNKQAQALEVTFSRTTKSYHSQTCFNNILRIYYINFYRHIFVRNAQMYIRRENPVYYKRDFLSILKYNSNHQYNTQ